MHWKLFLLCVLDKGGAKCLLKEKDLGYFPPSQTILKKNIRHFSRFIIFLHWPVVSCGHKEGTSLGTGVKGGMVAAPIVPMTQDPYRQLKRSRYSLGHSHLGGKFSVQLDGCTPGEWCVPSTLHLIIHTFRFCFLAFCELVRVVARVPYRCLSIMIFVQSWSIFTYTALSLVPFLCKWNKFS